MGFPGELAMGRTTGAVGGLATTGTGTTALAGGVGFSSGAIATANTGVCGSDTAEGFGLEVTPLAMLERTPPAGAAAVAGFSA